MPSYTILTPEEFSGNAYVLPDYTEYESGRYVCTIVEGEEGRFETTYTLTEIREEMKDFREQNMPR